MRLLGRWSFNPPKLSLGFTILLSGHHFIRYARNVVARLESELRQPQTDKASAGASTCLWKSWEEDRDFTAENGWSLKNLSASDLNALPRQLSLKILMSPPTHIILQSRVVFTGDSARVQSAIVIG